MSLEKHKIESFEKPVSALADRPQMSAQALKEWFDSNTTNEVKTALNNLIDELVALRLEEATLGAQNGIRYIRMNENRVMEVSADGKEWIRTGTGGPMSDVLGDAAFKNVGREIYEVCPGEHGHRMEEIDGFPTMNGGTDGKVLMKSGENVVWGEAEKVGDIKTTCRTDLGDKYLLCNGGTVSETEYPALYNLLENRMPDKPDGLEGEIEGFTPCEIKYLNGYYFLYASVGEKYIYYTNDLSSAWQRVEFDFFPKYISYENGYYIVSGNGITSNTIRIAFTQDPRDTWTANNVKIYSGKYCRSAVVYFNGYYIVHYYYSGNSEYAGVSYSTTLTGTWTDGSYSSSYNYDEWQFVKHADKLLAITDSYIYYLPVDTEPKINNWLKWTDTNCDAGIGNASYFYTDYVDGYDVLASTYSGTNTNTTYINCNTLKIRKGEGNTVKWVSIFENTDMRGRFFAKLSDGYYYLIGYYNADMSVRIYRCDNLDKPVWEETCVCNGLFSGINPSFMVTSDGESITLYILSSIGTNIYVFKSGKYLPKIGVNGAYAYIRAKE